MKKRTRIALVFLLIVAGGFFGAWQFVRPRDPLFRGQPESVWLANLKYDDGEQVKQWKEFGPDGVRFLARAYDNSSRPVDRLYRNTYRRIGSILPNALMRIFPNPKMDMNRRTRTRIVHVLYVLDKQDNIATPAMIRALDDEELNVQLLAIAYFIDERDKKCVLDTMEGSEREFLLSKFLLGTKTPDDGICNNSILALRHFPESADRVVPALVQALQHSSSLVRVVSAQTIAMIAPEQFNANVIQIVIPILKDDYDQIAYQAADLLGEMHKEPSLCVPALLDSVHNPNQTVATSAAQALGKFPEQAETIVPVLLKIHEDPTSSDVKWASKGSLKQLDPARFADLK